MAERGLLTRISSGGAPPDEAGAILAHLRVLLNTRRGSAPGAPSFGVPDFSDVVHALPGALPTVVESIRATIVEYEPRLRAVGVRRAPAEDDLVLCFEITAQLASNARTLRFATTIRPGGHVDVET